jgi:hypothetical protein
MNSVMTGSIVLVFLWNLDCRYSPVLPLTPIDDRQITTSLARLKAANPVALIGLEVQGGHVAEDQGTQARVRHARRRLRRQEPVA